MAIFKLGASFALTHDTVQEQLSKLLEETLVKFSSSHTEVTHPHVVLAGDEVRLNFSLGALDAAEAQVKGSSLVSDFLKLAGIQQAVVA